MTIPRYKIISALLAVAIAMMLVFSACADTGTKTPDPAGPGNNDPVPQEPVYPPLSQVPHPSEFEGRLIGNVFAEFVISEDGGLYSFVRPDRFDSSTFIVSLGREYDETAKEPTKILDNVAYVYAPQLDANDLSPGYTFYPKSDVAYAITNSGELYAWGNLPDGTQQITPLKITDDVAQVAHGYDPDRKEHKQDGYALYFNPLYILKKDGRLYLWEGEYNEGSNLITDHVVNIRYIDSGGADRICFSYGKEYTPVWITKDDGSTYYLQTQEPDRNGQQPPAKLVRMPIDNIAVHCGVHVLTTDGKVYAIDRDNTDRFFLIAENIVQLGCVYGEATMALTADGKVFNLPGLSVKYPYQEDHGYVKESFFQTDSNCLWFAGGDDDGKDFYWFTIDPEGRLKKTIGIRPGYNHGSPYVTWESFFVDENVCYANNGYYIKTDGSLWYVIKTVNEPIKTTKIMDGVMIPH